jgi:hypothetical protein
MLKAIILVCSVISTPELRDCGTDNAVQVVRVPDEFLIPASVSCAHRRTTPRLSSAGIYAPTSGSSSSARAKPIPTWDKPIMRSASWKCRLTFNAD